MKVLSDFLDRSRRQKAWVEKGTLGVLHTVSHLSSSSNEIRESCVVGKVRGGEIVVYPIVRSVGTRFEIVDLPTRLRKDKGRWVGHNSVFTFTDSLERRTVIENGLRVE